jgi:acetylglutamate kinase
MNALHKAEALVEALDYFRAFRKKIVVVKLGGSIMDDSSCLTSTLADLVLMETAGMFPVLVHGGGKAIDQAMAKQGLQPKKIAGRRITDDDTLAIVREVLTNDTNADIVRRIRNLGGRAIPLHTGAMQVLWGKKWLLPTENGFTDLGHVGIVDKVDNNLISDFISAGVIPVIPSLAIDDKNLWLNVNADTAACAVALSLKAEKLSSQCFSLIDSFSHLYSNYDSTSELSKLSKNAGNTYQQCSPALWDILLLSRKAYEQSIHAFDISIGPLSNLWRSKRKTHTFPDTAIIHETKQNVGLEKLGMQSIGIQNINIQDIQNLNMQDLNLQDLNIEQISFVDLSSSEISAPQTSSITEITDEPANLVESTSYEQMRVDDLRKVVSDKNLATKEEVKKLKKPELLLLLKK